VEISPSRGRWAGRIGWAVVAILPVAFLLLLESWRPAPPREEKAPSVEAPKKSAVWRDILSSPVVRPRAIAASDAGLRPDEPVLGVVVDGRARAYRLGAMESRSGHLINDVVGDVPVSVAYCDLTRCARAYTGPPGSGPLHLGVAGLLDGEMVLRADGIAYFQGSGLRVDPERLEASRDPVAVAYARAARQSSQRWATLGLSTGSGAQGIPHAAVTPILTTWKAWVDQHPDSDVSIGGRDRPANAPGPVGPHGR
jgi:Protein of unknown function (DUF3179)